MGISTEALGLVSAAMRAFVEATADDPALLQVITLRSAEALRCYCGVWVLSERTDQLELSAPAAGSTPSEVAIHSACARGGAHTDTSAPLMRCLQTDSAARAEHLHGLDGELDVKSVLYVPLRAHHRVLGVMTLVRHGGVAQRFADEELQLAETLASHAGLAISHARLFTASRAALDSRREMQARAQLLSDVTREFSAASRDYRRLLELVVRKLSEIVGDFCSMRLLSHDGESMELGGSVYHRDPKIVEAAQQPLLRQPLRRSDRTLTGRVLQTGEPVFLPIIDPAAFAASVEARYRPFVEQFGVRSLLAVPLMSEGRAFGIITLLRDRADHPYTPDDLRLVQDLAAHAALSIANARSFAAAQRMATRLQLISELTREFSQATGDYRSLVELIAQRVGRALGEGCLIRLVSPGSEFLDTIDGIYHRDPDALEAWRTSLTDHPQHINEGLSGRALATGVAILVPTMSVDEAVRQFERHRTIIERLAIRSMIVVPLRAEGESIGVAIVIRSDPSNPYTEEDKALLEELSLHASIAITTGQLFASLQRELAERVRLSERLRLFSELTHEFAEATGNYRGLLDLVAQRIGQAIGESCSIRMIAPDGEHLEREGALYHPDPDKAELVRATMRNQPQTVRDGVTGRVLQSGQGLIIPSIVPAELAASVAPPFRYVIERLDIRSLIIVPLRSEGRSIGVIAMSRSGALGPFAIEDKELLEDLASHASTAIRNSILLEAMQRELSERQRAEAALNETEEQLRQSQKMDAVGRLAGGVAHDFNNLLSVILSYASLLLDELPPHAPMRLDVDEIRKAGQRAADLTHQLLAFSRQQVVEPRVLDLNQVITGMAEMVRRLVGEHIEYRTLTKPHLGRIKADPGHLQQVIMNLAVNARDAMPRGGCLTVETADVELDHAYALQHVAVEPGPHVMLAVTDTGVGIDKAIQKRIFEPFFTTKETGKGTGLGLSTVFGIVKQSNGHVWLYSEPGHGTTFKIYFPRTELSESLAPPEIELPTLDGSETILLVEDEDQLRTVACGVLRRAGYHVLAACDGSEAIARCQDYAGEIQLLLTDVVMPKMSGREVAAYVQPLRPDMKVLYMSGYTDDAMVHHGVLAPGIILLQKPITPNRLLRKVREVLNGALGSSVEGGDFVRR